MPTENDTPTITIRPGRRNNYVPRRLRQKRQRQPTTRSERAAKRQRNGKAQMQITALMKTMIEKIELGDAGNRAKNEYNQQT